MTTRRLRLSPALSPTSLPAHPDLAGQQRTPPSPLPSLDGFLESVLTEALTFTTTTFPATFSPRAAKGSPPATAAVRLLGSTAQPGEAWFARRSEHPDVARDGTATMREFEEGLFIDHSVHEMAYTPNVFDAVEVLTWGSLIENLDGGRSVGGFTDVDMSIHELAHRMPSPLTNRVFPVLLVRGKTGPEHGTGFIVVQIPVDIWAVDAALYSNGRHRNENLPGEKGSKVVMGRYVSVERVKFLDEGEETTDATAFEEREEARKEEVAKEEAILEDAEVAKHEEVVEDVHMADVARDAEVVEDIEVEKDAEVMEHVAQGEHMEPSKEVAQGENVTLSEEVAQGESLVSNEEAAEVEPKAQNEHLEGDEEPVKPTEADEAIESPQDADTSEAAKETDSVADVQAVKSKERAIEWVMATASDAKGNLPMSVQKMGVPGAIIKDVGFFIGWVMKNRKLKVT